METFVQDIFNMFSFAMKREKWLSSSLIQFSVLQRKDALIRIKYKIHKSQHDALRTQRKLHLKEYKCVLKSKNNQSNSYKQVNLLQNRTYLVS